MAGSGLNPTFYYRSAGCLAAVGLLLLMTCCAVMLTLPTRPCPPERADVAVGMTVDEVRSRMGDPSREELGPGPVCWYYDCTPPLALTFKDGKVSKIENP